MLSLCGVFLTVVNQSLSVFEHRNEAASSHRTWSLVSCSGSLGNEKHALTLLANTPKISTVTFYRWIDRLADRYDLLQLLLCSLAYPAVPKKGKPGAEIPALNAKLEARQSSGRIEAAQDRGPLRN